MVNIYELLDRLSADILPLGGVREFMARLFIDDDQFMLYYAQHPTMQQQDDLGEFLRLAIGPFEWELYPYSRLVKAEEAVFSDAAKGLAKT